jgi:HAD superfamily hydrolase (TIGR01549 family)
MIRAVLFDLDDTLFDHKHSRLCGLAALQIKFPKLQAVPLEELEREHEKLLSLDYHLVLDGKISMLDGTATRIKKLYLSYVQGFSEQEAKEAGDLYNSVYMKNRQSVPGSVELLKYVKQSAKVGVVTNGLVNAQIEKLKICQIDEFIDFMVTSEEVGLKKPSKGIFRNALRMADATPSEALFVGDSWDSDILPAYSLGMKTVWLNRYRLTCPNPKITIEVQSYIGNNYINQFF